MTVNPPFSLEGKEPEDLPELAVEPGDDLHGCDCEPTTGPYPDKDESDPTLVKAYDKWDLWQCRRCGGCWWNHDVRADYGFPER